MDTRYREIKLRKGQGIIKASGEEGTISGKQ